MKFKTNIKCDGCIAKVAPVLDETVGAGRWQVDLSDPQRTLTMEDPKVPISEVKAKLAAVGYTIDEA